VFKRLFWLCTGVGFGFGSSLWVMRAFRRTVDRFRPTRVVARLEVDVRAAVAEGKVAAREREAALRTARSARAPSRLALTDGRAGTAPGPLTTAR
jgi:hypothetical protein